MSSATTERSWGDATTEGGPSAAPGASSGRGAFGGGRGRGGFESRGFGGRDTGASDGGRWQRGDEASAGEAKPAKRWDQEESGLRGGRGGGFGGSFGRRPQGDAGEDGGRFGGLARADAPRDAPRETRQFGGFDRAADGPRPFERREPGSTSGGAFEKRDFGGFDRSADGPRPFERREPGSTSGGDRGAFEKRDFGGFDRSADGPRPFERREPGSTSGGAFEKRDFGGFDRSGDGPRPFERREPGSTSGGDRGAFEKRDFGGFDRSADGPRPFERREGRRDDNFEKRDFGDFGGGGRREDGDGPRDSRRGGRGGSSYRPPGQFPGADVPFVCVVTGEQTATRCRCEDCRRSYMRGNQSGGGDRGGDGDRRSFPSSYQAPSVGGKCSCGHCTECVSTISIGGLVRGRGNAGSNHEPKDAPALVTKAPELPTVKLSGEELEKAQALAEASFKIMLKKLFKEVEDVDAADAVSKILKSKEVAKDAAIAEFAASFVIGKALEKSTAARDRRTLYSVLSGLHSARAESWLSSLMPLCESSSLAAVQTFTQDAFVHALEQNISAARASKDATSRFIEVAERLVSSELVSTDALDFSSVLRDFFTEHDAPQLLSSAAAAAGAPVDADSIARSIVASGAVGTALAEQAVSQLSVCPGPDASAALVRHVLATVAAKPGLLEKPDQWLSASQYGPALAAFMYDADEPEEDEDGETPADERSAEEKKIPNAIAGLTEIQAACAARGFPKGLLQSIFVRLHQDDIVKESGIFGWKDDTGASVEADGKGTALLQLNKWLEWLQEDEEEEDEEEEPEEADMGDVMKPNNSSMY